MCVMCDEILGDLIIEDKKKILGFCLCEYLVWVDLEDWGFQFSHFTNDFNY